ncbi:amino acid ABC transporter permease [Clostridium sp.]|uniref:amino acid ABC transporter permease n=1 Tax=Clostridium sp. TaxID=1506 RepID=UPI003D6D654B
MNFSFMSEYYMFFLNGAKFTLIIAFFSVLLGVIGGTIFALMKLSKSRILNMIATAYVEVIRGTPVLVQLYLVFYGLPYAGVQLPDMVAGIIALSVNSSAYVAEIIRGGINSINKGQMEAARSLGMSYSRAMFYIIIPQAIKTIIPILGNEFITIIKESSIVSIIGIHELSYNADTVRGNIFKPFEPLLVSAFMYFVMTFTLSKFMNRVEERMKISD